MPTRPSNGIARTLIAVLALLLVGCDGDSDPVACDPTDIEQIGFRPPGPSTFARFPSSEEIEARIRDRCGQSLSRVEVDAEWSSTDPGVVEVTPTDGAPSSWPSARLVARGFGSAEVRVSAGTEEASLRVDVEASETDAVGFEVVDHGEVHHATTDLWVHGDFAYSGSHAWNCPDCDEAWLYVWEVAAGGALQRVDSLPLPTWRINDVKISADGSFGVATMEALNAGENGIAMLDLTNPGAPIVLTRYSDELEQGVHNVWIERLDGVDYVFAAPHASADDEGVHILDVSDRAAPQPVARFHAGFSFPHDVYVRDGLAFVSHWNAGLVILDVGHGIAGGSPVDPVEVGRAEPPRGRVHNAWYWPERKLVFLGQEIFPPPDQLESVGDLWVVDVSDPTAPEVVAELGVPGASPHNFWLDEDAGILYAAWYENGLRAFDVSGELSGDLATQSLELGYVIPSGHRGAGSVWAPQLHNGVIYLSDIYNGLWSVAFGG